jgi:GTP pyrophosphokinase
MAISDNERNILVNKYRFLLNNCRPYLRKGDTSFFREAFNLVFPHFIDKHTVNGEPGIFFPLDVGSILALEMGFGRVAPISVLLSEAFYEQKIPTNILKQKFEPQVLSVLDGVRKISSLRTGKTAIHSENFIRLLLTISDDVRVVMIKLAECLYFMREIDHVDKDRQAKIATEAYHLYAPIAHRLGLYNVKTELEDLSMRFLHREAYLSIETKLKETKEARKVFIKEFIAPIEKQLLDQNLKFEIKGRPKSIHSIWTKMVKQGVSFEEVYDALAIRVILDAAPENEKSDCWKVYSVVSDIYSPNPSRLRDWISAPKSSGYESLHTTVQGKNGNWVEVQIRTRRMDEIAEKGHAAHWKYKENKFNSDSGAWLGKLRDLLENPDQSDDDTVNRLDIQSEHIFVFTPQGDLKKLSAGATLLDFAYEIHTDVGYHCTGGKVNGKIVQLRHILKNSDEVEILTSKNQKPKKDWLNIVISNRAKQKIKRSLKEDELKEAEAGKEIILRKLKNWKINFSDEVIMKIHKALKYKTPMDLYHALATGKIDLSQIKDVLLPPEKQEVTTQAEPDTDEKSASRKPEYERRDDFIFIDQDLAGIDYSIATCCNPIFGDEVFGFVTVSKGITIHRLQCPNAAEMNAKFDYRILNVRWRAKTSSTTFQTTIRISGIDSIGIVNTLSDIISNEMKANMRSLAVETNKGVFEGTIKLAVKDVKHLEMLLHRIKMVKGVLKATRLD